MKTVRSRWSRFSWKNACFRPSWALKIESEFHVSSLAWFGFTQMSSRWPNECWPSVCVPMLRLDLLSLFPLPCLTSLVWVCGAFVTKFFAWNYRFHPVMTCEQRCSNKFWVKPIPNFLEINPIVRARLYKTHLNFQVGSLIRSIFTSVWVDIFMADCQSMTFGCGHNS